MVPLSDLAFKEEIVFENWPNFFFFLLDLSVSSSLACVTLIIGENRKKVV